MTKEVDVVVIGAGPAGSVASSKLIKEGLKVLVLEKMQFPRFVIGESLLPHSMDYLDDLGLLPAVEALKFQVKTGACFSVIVPAIIIKSDWRGEKRTTSAPNLEASYFGPTTDMYSIAQQAVPKGNGHNEFD